MISHKFLCIHLSTLLALTAIGCGDAREELGVVTGQVTYDGEPVTGAIVLFQDDARGIHMQAKLDDEGRFNVSMAAGYGLPLGTYAVAVKPAYTRPGGESGPAELQQGTHTPKQERRDVPAKYRQTRTSGLTITVQRGGGEFAIEMSPNSGA